MSRRVDQDTSIEAGQRARSDAGRVKALVLRLHHANPDGLTDDELACELIGEHPGTLARRRKDLADEGLIEPTLFRRPTRRGSPAIVWRVVR